MHDNAYSEITFDGYVAPSFLQAPGAKEAGIEMFSLSKAYNMTGWRTGAAVGNATMIEALWKLKTNIDSGMFEAVQMASVRALAEGSGVAREMCEVYRRRRDLAVAALRAVGIAVEPPRGTMYIWVPVPEGHTSVSFTRAGAGAGRRRGVARVVLRPQRRGLRADLADPVRRAPARGDAADRAAPARHRLIPAGRASLY